MKQSTKEDERLCREGAFSPSTWTDRGGSRENEEKTNVIVHGLAESQAHEPAERVDDDLGLVASMLHETRFDDVDVAQTKTWIKQWQYCS